MKQCKDFAYTGVQCCEGCHEVADWATDLITIKVNGELALVCCNMANFFYPNGDWRDQSPTGQWAEDEYPTAYWPEDE